MITSEEFQQRHKARPQDFTRQSALTFPRMFMLIGRLVRKSLQVEADEFFQELFDREAPEREVTASAVCQARRKIRHTAWEEAARFLAEQTYAAKPNGLELPGGFRVLATDGFTVNLPDTPEIRAYFGPPERKPGQEGPPLARVLVCWDVYNDLVVDVLVAPYSVSERALLRQHQDRFSPWENVLRLLDRGFGGYCRFQRMCCEGESFVCRVRCDGRLEIREFVESGQTDAIVELHPDAKARKRCIEEGLPTGPLRLRVLRIDRGDGEPQVVVTNLFDPNLTLDFFRDVYDDRWGVEEGIKVLKKALEIERFSGRTVETVLQDVYARIFLFNLTSVLTLPLRDEVEEASSGKKYTYHVNTTTALSKVRRCIVRLLFGVRPLRILGALLKALRGCILPWRPGRSFPRKARAGPVVRYGNYSPI